MGGGVLRPIILASKNLYIDTLGGHVIAKDNSIGAIQIGFGSVGIVDKKYKRSLWQNTGVITFEGRANLGAGSKIVCGGKLCLGDGFTINANSDIICTNKIEFGADCLISWDCLLMDSDFHSIYPIEDVKRSNAINQSSPITIGRHVWIGCRSTVLKGARISDESVIAAGSIVSKNLKQCNSIYAGNIKIRENIYWGK